MTEVAAVGARQRDSYLVYLLDGTELRTRSARLPCILIGLAGLTFWSGHLPTVPVSMLLLIVATCVLEFHAPPARTANGRQPLTAVSPSRLA